MKRVCLVFCVLCITLCLTGCVFAPITRVYDSIDDYLVADVPLIYHERIVFPDKELLMECTVNQYRSVSKSTFLFDDVYFLLDCSYTSEQYEQEVQRLSQTGAEFRKDIFDSPAYVMLLSSNRYYEYAILDEENYKIIYVYANVVDWSWFEEFPRECLPQETVPEDICKYTYD